MTDKKRGRPGFVDMIHDKFYRWHEKMYGVTPLIATFTRAQMRGAYEEGYRHARLDLQRELARQNRALPSVAAIGKQGKG